MCIFSRTAPPRGASDGVWLSCHRMAHYVLIRCFLQPSLSEALCWRNFIGIGQTARRRRASEGGVYLVTAWRTTCLYGVSDRRASPRLYPGAIFVSNIPRCTSMV